jgi:uncharacterized OB-fold protein
MNKNLALKSLRTLKIKYNLPIGKTSKFWKELEKGKIFTTKCKKCKIINFPPVIDCGICGSSKVDWIELSGRGKILTYTKVFVKPASFSEEKPYIVAIAELDEGIKILSWITGVEIEEISVGKKVRLVPKVTENERTIYEFVLD